MALPSTRSLETIEAGIEMGGGPATVSARFAISVMEYYQNKMIKELNSDSDLEECARVIRLSFKTVADEFDLTPENAPTHPSNITYDKLKESVQKGLHLFGLQYRGRIAGCIGIEKSKENGVFYFEKLAVLPEYRHKGYGIILLNHASKFIKDRGGDKISIGIIDSHTILKNWYKAYGFVEKETKSYPHLPFTVCFLEKSI